MVAEGSNADADSERSSKRGVPETQADREARNPLYRWLMHLGFPMVASLGLHVVLFGVLAFKTWEVMAEPEIEVGEYEASLTEADSLESLFDWDKEEVLPEDEDLSALDQLEDLRDLDLDLSELESTDDTIGDLGMGEGESGGLLGIGTGAGEAGSGGFGGGIGGRRGLGVANMWGAKIFANKIVYVIDYSGSITVAVDDLKSALKRSIGGLKPSQSFNVVIFYSTGTRSSERFKTESYAPSLQSAIPGTKRSFFKWIDKKAPKGSTEPLPALKRALNQKPEAILFFSDGYFDESVVAELTRLNRGRRTKIYCFVFDEILLSDFSGLPPRETDGARRMKRIAEQNGKTPLKIVTGKDLRRG